MFSSKETSNETSRCNDLSLSDKRFIDSKNENIRKILEYKTRPEAVDDANGDLYVDANTNGNAV
jgi:hypothetical protein